jgi:hypothetical protein
MASVNGAATTVSGIDVAPTGTVDFADVTTASLGACTLVDGSCNVSLPAGTLASGPHTITSTYLPDASASVLYRGGTATVPQFVKFATSTTVEDWVNSDGTMTFHVSVPRPAGSTAYAEPDGVILFDVDGTFFASCTFAAGDGGCSFKIADPTSYSAGTHAIRALYQGNAVYAPSEGADSFSRYATRLALTQDKVNTNLGGAFTLAATVSVTTQNAASFDDGGRVDFLEAGNILGTCKPVGGACGITLTSLLVGSHTITAVYSGDARFAGSSGSVTHGVVSYTFTGFGSPLKPAGTEASPSSSGSQKYGNNLTFKWQVQDASGAYLTQPGGTTFEVWTWANGAKVKLVQSATGNTQLRYDATGKQFVYNLATSSLSGPGDYAFIVRLDDGSAYATLVKFTVK